MQPESQIPYVLVLTTAPSLEIANQLAAALVTSKLAACVNIMPACHSVYEWNNELTMDTEYLLMAKSRRECFAAIERTIKAQHPYELPELIALPICSGSADYLNWVSKMTGGNSQ